MAKEANMDNRFQHMPDITKNVLEYLLPNSVIFNLPFIMTNAHRLTVHMPYLLLDRSGAGMHIKPVRLLEIEVANRMLTLNVQDLQTDKIFPLSWNLDYDGDYWLWALIDLYTLYHLPK
jgi:hypothetical protein